MSQQPGFHGVILWIDLTSRSYRWEQRPVPFFRHFAGGGLLAAQLLLERTPPAIDPLGPGNLLVFAGSIVSGHPGAGLARVTVAAKSPLTSGIGETRCEGPWSMALRGSGADAIVFTGRSATPVSVLIERDKVAFLDARDQ